jgi:hypothetical protein
MQAALSARPLRRASLETVTADTPRIIRIPITRADVEEAARLRFGDMVKAAVDINREVMAIGGELHSDEEALLLEDGSAQGDIWGINLYPSELDDAWIEFDSMINVRPAQGNRSRGVEDPAIQARIRQVVTSLIPR